MRQLPNIALIGRMRSGKDSVMEILEEWGFPVVRLAFGDSMKEMAHLEFPDVPREPKPIQFYQEYGQRKRAADKDIFVNATMSKLWFEQALDRGHDRQRTYVVTDVRQPNEYAAVKDAGFVIVKVHASEEVRISRMKANGEAVSQEILNAPTESYIDTYKYDALLVNNWTRDELKRQMVQLIKKLTLKEEN
ncbi:hypothetical protein A6E27_23055 [Bacillus cereus]|nr:hypothetical protein A6E27_23055 [Bacillus cereus]